MLGLALVAAICAIATVVSTASFLLTRNKLRSCTRQLSDMKNKEVDIQSKVESVKDEMKLIRDLYIASDILIHLTTEDAVYTEIVNTLNSFYSCQQLILYALNDERRAFVKKYCHPDGANYPDEIEYANMKIQDVKNNQMISTMVMNSQGRPLYYIKLTGRRVRAFDGYMDSVFTDTDLNVFDIFAKQSSMVLDKLKAYSKMERMALTDSLTGLHNRHYAYMRIKQEIKRANRENYPVSILFVDIDKFKSINDTFGHDVGDLALKHVSTILKQITREYDIAIRWGGEEFVLFLPNTTEEGAFALAERLRVEIQNSNFKYCKMTTSLGLAAYPQDNMSIEKVISFADSALYHSKQSGRNRTTVYSTVSHLVK